MAEKKGKKKSKERIDFGKVESIVKRMKKKQAAAGLRPEEEVSEARLRELRGIISGAPARIQIQTAEDLKKSPHFFPRLIGNIYSAFGFVFRGLEKVFARLTLVKKLDYFIYSANMRYSGAQWLAIATVLSVIAAVAAFVLSGSYFILVMGLESTSVLLFALLLALAAFLFAMVISLLYPKMKADNRAAAINVELPFALRHMATELKAGIGLYKTLQTIAVADYGVLSEEFARTINEIEEGTDTRDALSNFAARTRSRSLRAALGHVIRALKTGGNLSDIMATIAADVSFDLRMKMRDFGEKMNFFGVIFIFVAIVLPVFVSVLGSIANAPVGAMFASMLPLDVPTITLFYLAVMPLILLWLIIYLRVIQPRV
jgi:flagellar protein FlaJ